MLSSWPHVGLELIFASYFVPSSFIVGKRSSVSSVDRFRPLLSVSSEVVILRFLVARFLFIFAILNLGKYSMWLQHGRAKCAAVINLILGAEECLVGVPKMYRSLNVVTRDHQWMKLEALGLAWGKTQRHTHNCDVSNPLLVQTVVVSDQSLTLNDWFW